MKQVTSKPWEILQAIASRNLSGCLTITHAKSELGWQLFFGDGCLTYGTSMQGQIERLQGLWEYLPTKFPLPNFLEVGESGNQDSGKSDYELLCDWKQTHQLSITAFRALLVYLTKEALVQVLSYERINSTFQSNQGVKPVMIMASIKDLTKPSLENIRKWRSLRSLFPSPFARIWLGKEDVGKFFEIWEQVDQTSSAVLGMDSPTMSNWIHLLLAGHNLYELAAQVAKEPLELAEWLQPYIEAGVVKVAIALAPSASSKPVVACIDDSKTVQRQVKMILEMANYEVLSITDPASCLSALIKKVPQLILMDINMPEIDGYELSSMLRRSQKLKDVPIVMLTGRDGIIDRLRAQFVGAVDFMTKPVQSEQLLERVQQLTQPLIEPRTALAQSKHQQRVAS